MFNKFRSAFYNVVGNFDLTSQTNSSSSSTADVNGASSSKQSKSLKYPYTRPSFLQLNSEEEILVTADHAIRPIICPRNISNLPWNAGYAETVNAGKTKKNEDQAAVFVGHLTKTVPGWTYPTTTADDAPTLNGIDTDHDPSANPEPPADDHPLADAGATMFEVGQSQAVLSGAPSTTDQDDLSRRLCVDASGQLSVSLPYYYFAVFDGHAGWGAAVHAANELHEIIHEKLLESLDLLLPQTVTSYQKENTQGPLWFMETVISPDLAVIGALEQSFWQMDQQIAQDRLKYQLSGGCTACVGLFILGKLYVANAGDSRATMSLSGRPFGMSNDFTPETENYRVRAIGAAQPELLGGEFTSVEFLHRPLKRDVGKKALYRDHYMSGWGYKTVTSDDLKYPLVSGEGKRSRVLATIGVTRGFGDHDLKALHCSLPIKPFLSPVPEVLVYDLSGDITEDDCLILGTDGLWDITSNKKAASSVNDSLKQFPSSDDQRHLYRYTSAAQDLVVLSRGKFKDYNWKTADDKYATIDDITAFAVPLLHYKHEWAAWKAAYDRLMEATPTSPTVVTTSGGGSDVSYKTWRESVDCSSSAVSSLAAAEVADDALAVEKETLLDVSTVTLVPDSLAEPIPHDVLDSTESSA